MAVGGGRLHGKTSPARRQQGQVILLFAVALPVLVALLALAMDLGGATITYHRAQIALDAATFAAAQAVDQNIFDHTQRVELDPYVAGSMAGQYASLNSRGELVMTSFEVRGDTVFASGRMLYRPLFAGLFGVDVIRARVTSSAGPGFGVVEGGE